MKEVDSASPQLRMYYYSPGYVRLKPSLEYFRKLILRPVRLYEDQALTKALKVTGLLLDTSGLCKVGLMTAGGHL